MFISERSRIPIPCPTTLPRFMVILRFLDALGGFQSFCLYQQRRRALVLVLVGTSMRDQSRLASNEHSLAGLGIIIPYMLWPDRCFLPGKSVRVHSVRLRRVTV